MMAGATGAGPQDRRANAAPMDPLKLAARKQASAAYRTGLLNQPQTAPVNMATNGTAAQNATTADLWKQQMARDPSSAVWTQMGKA